MVIHLYTFCYNEMDILPFVVDYWKLFADKVIVYDNYSTDGSYEYLQQFDFVELRRYDTDNKLNDVVLTQLKNSIWKESIGKSDYVVVCDIDECVYGENIKETLDIFKDDDIACIKPMFCNMISLKMPKYKNNTLLHEQVKNYYIDYWQEYNEGYGIKDKIIIFNPNFVIDINYNFGAYVSNPNTNKKIISTDKIKCIHLHDVGLCRKIKRYNERALRMSEENIKMHLSDFYREDKIKITHDFMEDLSKSKII